MRAEVEHTTLFGRAATSQLFLSFLFAERRASLGESLQQHTAPNTPTAQVRGGVVEEGHCKCHLRSASQCAPCSQPTYVSWIARKASLSARCLFSYQQAPAAAGAETSTPSPSPTPRPAKRAAAGDNNRAAKVSACQCVWCCLVHVAQGSWCASATAKCLALEFRRRARCTLHTLACAPYSNRLHPPIQTTEARCTPARSWRFLGQTQAAAAA